MPDLDPITCKLDVSKMGDRKPHFLGDLNKPTSGIVYRIFKQPHGKKKVKKCQELCQDNPSYLVYLVVVLFSQKLAIGTQLHGLLEDPLVMFHGIS